MQANDVWRHSTDHYYEINEDGVKRWIVVRHSDNAVFDLSPEDHADYGHIVADGLEVTSKPVVG